MSIWTYLAAAYGVFTGLAIAAATLTTFLLALYGRRTLSERVWAEPWLGYLVIAWLAFGVMGLALHFFVERFH